MIEIDLQQIPNQEFYREIDGNRYNLKIRTFKGITLMDVSINDVVVKHGVRVCPNTAIIPYEYLKEGGNFFFVCLNGDYPHYSKFGITQTFVYLTDEEIKEYSANAE